MRLALSTVPIKLVPKWLSKEIKSVVSKYLLQVDTPPKLKLMVIDWQVLAVTAKIGILDFHLTNGANKVQPLQHTTENKSATKATLLQL